MLEKRELSWPQRGRLWLRLLVRLLLAALAVLLILKIGAPLLSFCMPFALGFVFAWLMEPLLRILIRKTILSRKAVAIILILLICGAMGGLLYWVIYKLFIEISALSSNWGAIWTEMSNAITELTAMVEKLFTNLPPEVQAWTEKLSNQLLGWFRDLGANSLIPRTTSFAVKIPSVTVSLIFFLMSLYFIMADYPRIGAVVTDWMPANFRRFLHFLEKAFQSAFGGYIRAELLLSLVVFVILLLGFSFMGLPYALVLAFGLAVLDFIPIIGSGTVMVPWAVVDLVLGNWKTSLVLMVIWSIIVVFRRVAEPRFLGSQTGLHPVLSLLSIYIGMKAFGVLGMILAPTLLLVVINVCASGVFDALVADVTLAFQDVTAFMKGHREEREADAPPPPKEPLK